MRWIAPATLLAVVALGPTPTAPARQVSPKAATPAPRAAAPVPRANPPDPARQAKMEALLQAWAKQSAATTSLNARFKLVERGEIEELTKTYTGQALLQAPNLACLNKSKVEDEAGPDGRRETFHERIICTGLEVWQYRGPSKQIYIFPLAKDRQSTLQQGPLPFLFNMRVDEAKARYDMTFLGENETVYTVRIIPRMPIDRESFIQAVIYLNKKTFLPDRLVLVDPNGKDRQEYTFDKVERNVAIPAVNFRPAELRGWTLHRNPVPGAESAAAPAPAPAVNRPAAPPAQTVPRTGILGRRRN